MIGVQGSIPKNIVRHAICGPRSLTYIVLCSLSPVELTEISLLLGTKEPSLPFVTRRRWTVVPVLRANWL